MFPGVPVMALTATATSAAGHLKQPLVQMLEPEVEGEPR